MFPGLDISTTGMVAQRIRLNAISSNMANISTTRNELGQLGSVMSVSITLGFNLNR